MKTKHLGLMSLVVALPFVGNADISAAEIGAHSYVTNGLVALWDGAENAGYGNHSPFATAWTDLVGGRSFTLHGLTWGADYLQFDGNASHYGDLSSADTSATFGAASDKTVEFVSPGIGSSGNQIVLKAPCSTGVAYGFAASYVVFASGTSNKKKWKFNPGSWVAASNITYSADYSGNSHTSALFDNQVPVGEDGDYWGQDVSSTFIGKRGTGSSDNPFNGRLTCMRVYSKVLSADEKSWNYAIDQVRFHGADPNSFEVLRNNDFAPLVNAKCPKSSVAGVSSYINNVSAEVNVTSFGEGSESAKIYIWCAPPGEEFGTPVVKAISSVGTYVITHPGLKGGSVYNYRIAVESQTHYFGDGALGEQLVGGANFVIDSKSYIRNGLLANWDGIDNSGYKQHNESIAAWLDVENERPMTLTGTETRSDSIYFTGATGSPYSYGEISASDTEATFEATAAKTLQLRIRNAVNTSSIWLKSTYAAGVAFGYDQSRLIVVSNAGTKQQTFGKVTTSQVTTTNSWTVVYDSDALPVSAYFGSGELAKLASGDWDYWGQGVSSTFIGRRHNSTNSPCPTDGNMYALRLYGRALTEDEIKWNDAVDRVRFEGADPSREPIFCKDLVPIREYTSCGAATSTASVTRNGDGYVHTFTEDGTFTTTEPLAVEVLVVGGGGGGGCGVGGGGGGGGAIYCQTNLPAGTYQVVVGAGGLGAQTTNDSHSFGENGGDSSFGTGLIAHGGGGGAGWQANQGKNGATGGGSCNNNYGGNAIYNTVPGDAPQGYAGGKSGSRSSSGGGGAGGPGGAGDPAGSDAQKMASAVGGRGLRCDITGEVIAYGGGGGGGGGDNGYCPGSLGTDGGGDGTDHNSTVPAGNGIDGLGGGGGGSGYASNVANVLPGGNGGRGIVIVAYGKSDRVASTATNVVYSGNTQIHIFGYNGTFMTMRPLTVDLLLVGGGGGGGMGVGGGGGGGGVIYKEKMSLPAGIYSVAVGLGGAGATANASLADNGGNSFFGDDLIAYGGGGGAGWGANSGIGANGATGGGGCGGGVGGSAIHNVPVIQGYAGGTSGSRSSSGGGGAGGPGGDGDTAGSGKDKAASAVGGIGVKCSITGTEIAYGGGGGGGGGDNGACPGSPGTDGGGDGTDYNAIIYPGAGEDGRGGGGGGSGYGSGKYGGNGGKGTVILRFSESVAPSGFVIIIR